MTATSRSTNATRIIRARSLVVLSQSLSKRAWPRAAPRPGPSVLWRVQENFQERCESTSGMSSWVGALGDRRTGQGSGS